ncbi:MAG: hypothetical protein ACTIBG_10945 [Brevibacterium aurantiacum]|uniref:hypothetical protein n=1 Tax=Brevibacterium aurantiacum TaxID=273384 RepID=UPI003F922860
MGETLMSMQDIADLAGVTRPAVSQWRRRTKVRGRDVPFPQPSYGPAGRELFETREVVDWLRSTGRGNNAEFAEDAPAAGIPAGVTFDQSLILLCLRDNSEDDLSNLDESTFVEIAMSIDPADGVVLSEVIEGNFPAAALEFVDDLYSASYGAPDALDRLESGRLGRNQERRGFSRELVDIVAAVVDGLVAQAGLSDGGVEQPGAGRFVLACEDLDLLAIAQNLAGLDSHDRTDSSQLRDLRRRALLRGWLALDVDQPKVTVTSVHGLERTAALEKLDHVVLDLKPSEYAIIAGSADLLCDRLEGTAERHRSESLRGSRSANHGPLVGAIRLPRGLWKHAPRQNSGLWILKGQAGIARPWVADLSETEIDSDELAADIAGVLATSSAPNELPARAFRYVRVRDIRSILRGEAVVPPGTRAVSFASDRHDFIDDVRAASIETAEAIDVFDIYVNDRAASVVVGSTSLGAMIESGTITRHSGSRIDAALAEVPGMVPVVDARRSGEVFRVDAFVAENSFRRSIRTLPGDVVYCPSPSTAWVDGRGGSLVLTPNKILRLGDDARIGPHTLAAVINDATSKEYANWQVPSIPVDQVEAVEDAMRRLSEYRQQLQVKERAAMTLGHALLSGVASGTMELMESSLEPRTSHGR